MTHKQEAQEAHKIAALMYLLGESVYKFAPRTLVAIQLKTKAEEIMPLADEMLEEIYKISEIRNSTYLTDLVNKIDTVIRKNFIDVQ